MKKLRVRSITSREQTCKKHLANAKTALKYDLNRAMWDIITTSWIWRRPLITQDWKSIRVNRRVYLHNHTRDILHQILGKLINYKLKNNKRQRIKWKSRLHCTNKLSRLSFYLCLCTVYLCLYTVPCEVLCKDFVPHWVNKTDNIDNWKWKSISCPLQTHRNWPEYLSKYNDFTIWTKNEWYNLVRKHNMNNNSSLHIPRKQTMNTSTASLQP